MSYPYYNAYQQYGYYQYPYGYPTAAQQYYATAQYPGVPMGTMDPSQSVAPVVDGSINWNPETSSRADEPLYPPGGAKANQPLYPPASESYSASNQPLYPPGGVTATDQQAQSMGDYAQASVAPTSTQSGSAAADAGSKSEEKKKSEKEKEKSKRLEIYGNELTMNFPEQLVQNILESADFQALIEYHTVPDVLQEVENSVNTIAPWQEWSVPTYTFILLFKLFKLRLTNAQMVKMLKNKNPYVRAMGLLYLRFTLPPKQLWDWFQRMFNDDEEFEWSPKRKGTIATLARELLTENKFFEVVLPRIPVAVARELKAKIDELGPPRGRSRRDRRDERDRHDRERDDKGERRKRSRSKSPEDSSSDRKRSKTKDSSDSRDSKDSSEEEVSGPTVEEKFAAAAPKKIVTREDIEKLKAMYGDASTPPTEARQKQSTAPPTWEAGTESFSLGTKRR